VGRKRDSNRRSHSRKGRCREVGRASAKTVAPLAGTESSNPFPPPVDLSQQVKFSRLQAKGWLSSLVGLLTVGVRPARQEPARRYPRGFLRRPLGPEQGRRSVILQRP
jgi:hypothetical protein